MARNIKRVKYTRFSVCSEEGSDTLKGEGINCDLTQGKIEACGVAAYPLAGDPALVLTGGDAALFASAGENTCAYVSTDGSLFFYDADKRKFVLSASEIFSHTPSVAHVFDASGTETIVFASQDGVRLFEPSGNTLLTVSEEPAEYVCVLHDRIFTAKDYRVRFCAPLKYDDWTEDADGGGYIDFPSERGKITGLLRMNERVAVFFERGILLLSAGGAARDFVGEEIFYLGGRTCAGSVCRSGGYAVFLAEDGAYSFDGKKTEKLFGNDLFGKAERCRAVSHAGKGYVTIFADTGNKTVAIDAENKSGYLLSAEFCVGLSDDSGTLVCASDGKRKKIETGGTLPFGANRAFKVRDAEFGIYGNKLLKSLKMKGAGAARIAISGEREGHAYSVENLENGVSVYPLLKGKSFSLSIAPTDGSMIESLEAEIVRYEK